MQHLPGPMGQMHEWIVHGTLHQVRKSDIDAEPTTVRGRPSWGYGRSLSDRNTKRHDLCKPENNPRRYRLPGKYASIRNHAGEHMRPRREYDERETYNRPSRWRMNDSASREDRESPQTRNLWYMQRTRNNADMRDRPPRNVERNRF
jgi:hypothetical protein